MILKVARLGHPVLRRIARDLTLDEIRSDDMRRFVTAMIETMHEYDGVGLAAPQVHESFRAIVMGAEQNERYPAAPNVALTVLFNLRLEPVGTETIEDWEGCLSVPGFRGIVPRYAKVLAKALDQEGEPVEIEAEGFAARVLQHEHGHLEGEVYLDRMRDMRSLAFLEEWHKHGGA